MTLDGAIAASTAMMAAAFVQQSAEHLRPAARAAERRLFAMRITLSAVLLAAVPLAPVAVPALLAGLMLLHLAILPFFNGPYNGGADRMSLLLLVCLTLAWWLPAAREPAFGEPIAVVEAPTSWNAKQRFYVFQKREMTAVSEASE